jgi:imidazolonepropionase-like amidohydrolase
MPDRTSLLLITVAAILASTMTVTPKAPSLVIADVNIVDVARGQIIPNSTVRIDDGRITSVAQGSASPADARVVDGRGKFLIPGLWDMHAHTDGAGKSSLQLQVANGITGIRDMGSDLELILRLRDATASGSLLGPRIVAAGPILDDAPGDWPFRMRVRNAEEGKAAVQQLKRRSVDLIKVHNNTPRAAFFAIATEARRLQLPVAGHVPFNVTPQEAIDAGLTNIEHLSEGRLWVPCSGGNRYEPEACRAFIEMLARRRIWQTPTLVASELMTIGTPSSSIGSDQLAYADKRLRALWVGNQSLVQNPEALRILAARRQASNAMTGDMAKAGVPILAGCDLLIAGFCLHDELAAFVGDAGMTPLTALRTATLNPARYLGLESSHGTVSQGKVADLVLLDDNPLTDIANVRRIRAVVVRGRLLDRPELDKVLAAVKIAAAK